MSTKTLTVTYNAPTNNGGSPILDYTGTFTPGNLTGTSIGAALTLQIPNVPIGQTGTVSVVARNQYGNSAPSAPSAPITPAVAPGAPTGLTATPGDTTLTFIASAPADNGGSTITQYNLTVNPGNLPFQNTAPTIIATGLVDGTSYTGTMTASNAAGTSIASNPATGSPQSAATVPGLPATAVLVAGNASASLTWTAPAFNGGVPVTGYSIRNDVSGSIHAVGVQFSENELGLTNGTGITFSVAAINSVGTGAYKTSNSVVPSTIPDAPTIGTLTAGSSSVSVTFTDNGNGGSLITNHLVTLSNGNTATGNSPVTVSSPNGTAVTATVQAQNANGFSLASAASNSGTPAGGALNVITPDLITANQGRGYFSALKATGAQPGSTLVYTDAHTSTNFTVSSTGLVNGARNSAGTDTVSGSVTDGTNTASFSYTITTAATTGVLAVSFTPPDAVNGGSYTAQVKPTGGRPPYAVTLSDTSIFDTTGEPYDGWITASPTATGTNANTITVTDAAGATATASITFNVTNTLRQYGCDQTSGATNRIGDARSAQKYSHSFLAAGGSGTGYSASLSTGSLPTGLSFSGMKIVGTPSVTGTFNLSVIVTDSAANASAAVVYTLNILPAYAESRPAAAAGYTAGTGFFTKNGLLFDPNGAPFRVRGVNSDHYDDTTDQFIQKTQSNGVRLCASLATVSSTTLNTLLNTYITKDVYPFLSGFYMLNGSTVTSGSTDIASAGAVLNYYCTTLAGTSILTTLNASGGFNPFNEFSPSDTGWRDFYTGTSNTITSLNTSTGVIAYSGTNLSTTTITSGYVYLRGAGGITAGMYPITASSANSVTVSGLTGQTYTSGGVVIGGVIGCLRAAGYKMPLLIDANSFGQGLTALNSFGVAVAKSDPLLNTILSLHMYNNTPNFEVPVTAATAGSSTSVTYTYASPLNVLGVNGGANVDPFKKYASGTANPNATSVIGYGFGGISNINGKTLSMGSWAGSAGAWTASLSGTTTTGTYSNSTGYLYSTADVRVTAQALAAFQSQGVMAMVGEFGPATPYLSPTPTPIQTTALQVIAAAEACGLSWLDWAWDDGALSSPPRSAFSNFALAGFNGTSKGQYTTPANLTSHGRNVVNNTAGLQGYGQPAPVYL